VHTVTGQHFDWSSLLGAAQALSLFADRQLVEIRIPSGKPGKDGGEALQRLAAEAGPDSRLLVHLPRLDWQQQKTAWFNALDAASVSVAADVVERNALPAWLTKRFALQGQRVPQGTVIGYVGMTGLATGPHLHYEFRINGVHRNPLSVTMPPPEPLGGASLAQFRAQTSDALARIQRVERVIYAGVAPAPKPAKSKKA